MEWAGNRTPLGYGRCYVDGKLLLVHRALMMFCGFSIEGCQVCHHCDNPPCCNPEHLYVGTAATNAKDRVDRGRHSRVPGEQSGRAKLDWDTVYALRCAVAAGEIPNYVARRYGISYGITSILKWARWHPSDDPKQRVHPPYRPSRFAPRSPETILEVCELFRRGVRRTEIALHCELTLSGVCKILKRHGLT